MYQRHYSSSLDSLQSHIQTTLLHYSVTAHNICQFRISFTFTMLWITPYILTFFSGSTKSEIFLYVYFFRVLCNDIALSFNPCWICLSLDDDVHGKRIGGTGEIIVELWEVSMELGDVPLLTVCGVSYHSRDTPEDLQIVDEPCCLEVPAFWKKSIPQFSSNIKHCKLREEHINTSFLQTTPTHKTTQNLKL